MTDSELVAELERLRKTGYTHDTGWFYDKDLEMIRTRQTDGLCTRNVIRDMYAAPCDMMLAASAVNALPRLLELAREAIAARAKDGAK